MSILDFAQWIQSTDWATYLRTSAYIYPTILSTHLAGIALFAGAILVTDLRLLGLVMRNQPVSEVIDRLRWPKRVGFLIVATCGLLLASSKAEEYYYNSFFRAKLALLVLVAVHALVFRGSVYNKATALDDNSQTMTWGAGQLGIAQGVLDAVADGLLDTSGDLLVLVAVWVDPGAHDETAVRIANREAVRKAIGVCVEGRNQAAAAGLVERRDRLQSPFYSGD